jgi:hypothetical protein
MFGFVKSENRRPQLGGEIYREIQKKRKIAMAVLGIVAFAIFNLILYYISNM